VTATTAAVDRVTRARESLSRALAASASIDLSFLPDGTASNGWAAAPDLLRLLYALVLEVHPQHVVEFGSGVSTAVLAHAAREAQTTVVTSVEHDPKFAKQTLDLIGDDADVVSMQTAPLVARVRAGRLSPSYLVDPSRLASTAPADLVLVDGPPQILGGRGGMLPHALEYAQCGSVVLFDDADREEECASLESWKRQLGNAIELLRPEGFARGLAVIILVAPNTAQIRMDPTAA
jgi:predicted O-methyltransferase YrrM